MFSKQTLIILTYVLHERIVRSVRHVLSGLSGTYCPVDQELELLTPISELACCAGEANNSHNTLNHTKKTQKWGNFDSLEFISLIHKGAERTIWRHSGRFNL